jgi:hypothetical protein
MKIKFSYILKSLIIAGASLFSFASLAQEEGLPSYELQDANNQELNINNEDKTLIYEQDLKTSKHTSSESQQNTTTATPAKGKNLDLGKQASSNTNTKEGEDALSFNFLYYIIQKYKGSDIIDQ